MPVIYPQKDFNNPRGNLTNGSSTSSGTSNAYNINTSLNSAYFKEQEARTTIYDANGNLSSRTSNNGVKNQRIDSSNDPSVVDRCMPFSMFRSFFSSAEVGNNKNKNTVKMTNGNGNGNLNCVSASSPLESVNKQSDNIDGNNIVDENGDFNPNDDEYFPGSYLSLGTPRRNTENVSYIVKNKIHFFLLFFNAFESLLFLFRVIYIQCVTLCVCTISISLSFTVFISLSVFHSLSPYLSLSFFLCFSLFPSLSLSLSL